MKDQKTLLWFLAKVAVLYVIWLLLEGGPARPDGPWNWALTRFTSDVSVAVMQLMGFKIDYYLLPETQNTQLYVDGRSSIQIGPPCNGLVLMVIFAGFVLAYPGAWLRKLLFIPLGILGVYVINVIRVVLLCINYTYFPDTFQFNHEYTFIVVVYSFIFGLWMWWSNRWVKTPQTA